MGSLQGLAEGLGVVACQSADRVVRTCYDSNPEKIHAAAAATALPRQRESECYCLSYMESPEIFLPEGSFAVR
jgi:hypothetical protein